MVDDLGSVLYLSTSRISEAIFVHFFWLLLEPVLTLFLKILEVNDVFEQNLS